MKKRLCLFLIVILTLAVVAGIVTAVYFLTDPVDKKPDDTTQQTDPGDTTNQAAEKFLKGEISATDKDGRKVTIRDYIRGDYNKYALYDMSGDAAAELIIRTGNGLTVFNANEQDLTVWYQGTTYEKPLNNRAIFYERPGGAPEHTDYQYIVLDHNGKEMQRTSFTEIHGDNPEYIINGEKASKTDYEALHRSFNLTDNALVWKDILPVEETNPDKGETIQVAEPFASVLNSEKSFYFENEGKSVILSDYYKTIWKLTSVDVDHDGNKEIAVMFGAEDGTLILWQDGTAVYGYEFGFREMYRLNKDGTFLWNTNSGNTYGCSSIAFVGTKVETTEVWRVEHDGSGCYTYYAGKKPSTKEVVNAIQQIRNSEGVGWTVLGSDSTIVGTAEEWKEPEDPYALQKITDGRVVIGEKYQIYRDSFISLHFPLGWKCLGRQGEDGRFIYFQDPVLGENCRLSIYLSGAIYTYNYTREDYMAHLTGYYGYEDVVIDSFTKETIQGFPCTKIVYSYTEENTRFVGIRYDDLIEGPRLYHSTITYPAAESKTYEKEFAAIIESVWFLRSNQVDISSLPLEEAYDYALRHSYVVGDSSQYRDIGKLQPETQQVIEISGNYYQSYVASNADIRYIWISKSEFPDNGAALWDWYTVGSAQVYSLDLLGKIDEGRSGEPTR